MKQHKWSTRLIAGLLAAVLLICVLPATALKADAQDQCTCTPVDGVHDAACALYTAPETDTSAEAPVEDESADPAESTGEAAENADETAEDAGESVSAADAPMLFAASPRASGPTLGAEFTNGTDSTTLVSSGEAIAEDWDYEDGNRYLNLHVDGLDENQTYTLEVIMDEAVYAAQIPASQSGYSVAFKQGKKLPANGKENVYLHDRSGTITYTISKMAKVDLGVQFYYDTVLWNRDAGAKLCWNEGPLIDVVLKDSAGNRIGNVYLSNATSAQIHKENVHSMGQWSDPAYLAYPVVGQHKPCDVITNTSINAEATVKNATTNVYISLRSYRKDPECYYENLRMTVNLPTCSNVNGKKYTMEVYKIVFPSGATHANIPYTVDTSQPGKYIIEFQNLYLTDYPICDIYLRFSDAMRAEVLADNAEYQFTGSVAYTSTSPQYYKNTLQKTAYKDDSKYFGRIAVDWGNKANVIINTASSAKLEVSSIASTVTSNYRPANTVSFLGTYGLRNKSATITSGPLIVEERFDVGNTNNIGVTTVTLMSPTGQTYLDVEYTLVDKNGNLYKDSAGKSTFNISVKSERGEYTYATKLYRNMLPTEQRGYYFKTVKYRLNSVQPNEEFANSYRPYAFAYSGYWGYILDDSLMNGAIAQSEFRIYDGETGEEMSGLRRTFTTTLADTRQSSGILVELENTEIAPTQVTAGESFYLQASWRPDLNQYGNVTWVDQASIAILLPAGMFIDENNVSVYTHAWGGNKANITATVLDPIPQGDGQENLWIIQLDPQVLFGYTTERLSYATGKLNIGFSIKVLTSTFVKEQQLHWYQRLFVAGDHFTFTAEHSGNKQDIYDLNKNGSTTDYVSGFEDSQTAYTNVRAVDSNIDLVGSMGVGDDLKVEGTVLVLDATQTVLNNYIFTNDKGGQVTDLNYFIQIPQQLASMNGKGSVVLEKAATASANTVKFLYTTESLTREQAKTYNGWLEANQVTDFSKVTMVKIVLADQAMFENGTVTDVSLSLKFVGDYAVCAGAVFSMYASGSYTYYRAPYSKTLAQDTIEIKGMLTYTAEVNDSQELTLTAAQGMAPASAAGVRQKEITVSTEFIKSQNYAIAYDSIKLNNVQLRTGAAITTAAATMSSNEANTIFGIQVKLNDGTAVDLADLTAGASASLGSYTGAPSFTFTLFNADALTENTLDRWISFDIVGDNGVTIPIKINIKRILATISNARSTIEAGESYVLLGSTLSEATIAVDSAFTVQFVSEGLTNAYNAWHLTFGTALPKNSTIIMVDWTVADKPVYAYYYADGTSTVVNHTAFTIMGSSSKLTNIQSKNGKAELLFIVDLPDNNTSAYNAKITLTYTGTGADAPSSQLTCNAAGNRSFDASFTSTSTAIENAFTLQYSVGNANPDSRYSGRTAAVVLKANSNLPEDAYLLVNGVPYYRTSDQEFVVPLTAANVAISGSLSMRLVSASMIENGMGCVLNGQLWISATSTGMRPFEGELVTGSDISITLNKITYASLKVISVSDRSLTPDDFADTLNVVIKVLNVPTGASVTMELQEQLGQGYNTTTTAVSAVTGSATYSNGVCMISYSNGQESTLQLTLNRSGMHTGNYRLLFKITDSKGTQLVEVPYRFIVTE